jgi:hypothetical protein
MQEVVDLGLVNFAGSACARYVALTLLDCIQLYVWFALQEIVGLGLANFAGSAFNAYSTTGSFSRSAVNYDSGEAGSGTGGMRCAPSC